MTALALQTFLRLTRKRIWRIAGLGMLVLIAVYQVGFVSFARTVLPISALSHPAGLAHLLAMLFAAYLSVTFLAEDKAVGYTSLLMTKPLAPWQYLAGRMLGCLMVLALFWVGMCLTLALSYALLGHPMPVRMFLVLLPAFFAQALGFALGAALCQLISPVVAGLIVVLFHDRIFFNLTVGLDLSAYPAPLGQIIASLGKILYFIVPQISAFTYWGTDSYAFLVDPWQLATALLYGFFHLALLFAIALKLFEKGRW